MRPTTRYARSGDYSIAYQVVGDGPLDLVYVPGFISHVEHAWEDPDLALSTASLFSRLILFDKRARASRTGSLSTSSPRSKSAWTTCGR
jgi:hypothetical protein